MGTTVTTEQVARGSLGPGVASLDAAVVTSAYQAAEAYVAARCTWRAVAVDGLTPVDPPDALVTAVTLLTARYLERRNTPSGVLGSGDFGVVRVSGSDRDVDALIAPWRKRVLG
jgi:hypothetical protein